MTKKHFDTHMTGLDGLIGVGYRSGDKAKFQTKSTVSQETREHEKKVNKASAKYHQEVKSPEIGEEDYTNNSPHGYGR